MLSKFHCRSSLKEELCVQPSITHPESTNSSGAETLQTYLLGCLCKLLIKKPVQPLESVTTLYISPFKGGFNHYDRQIWEWFVWRLSWVIWEKPKINGIILKINVEKAIDCIKWSFSNCMLGRTGPITWVCFFEAQLQRKWRKLLLFIVICLQGEKLSSFLFTIVIKVKGATLKAAKVTH